jgi:RNA polymerase sigma factor (sigma-70 family)
MRDRSDEQLMKSYAGGSIEAFEVLYERYRGPLYRYILRLAAEPATANDLYQGCWEKIIKARERYSPSAPFKAWMYRIAHNHMMDHFRRMRPESDLPGDEMESGLSGPDEQLADDVRKQDLRAAIISLPPDQRDALLLKLETGLDLRTIAEVTGVNPETAKSRLRYAVKRLKQTLGDQGRTKER